MSYGDCNFAHSHADTFRAVLFWGTLLACLCVLFAVACRDIKQPTVDAPVQYAPRNIPDGNTHLQR